MCIEEHVFFILKRNFRDKMMLVLYKMLKKILTNFILRRVKTHTKALIKKIIKKQFLLLY